LLLEVNISYFDINSQWTYITVLHLVITA